MITKTIGAGKYCLPEEIGLKSLRSLFLKPRAERLEAAFFLKPGAERLEAAFSETWG